MDKPYQKAPIQVVKCIEVEPSQLIEIGQRLRSAAMDRAYPGQSVIIPFTPDLAFIYNPEREFCKPVHRVGDAQAFLKNES